MRFVDKILEILLSTEARIDLKQILESRTRGTYHPD